MKLAIFNIGTILTGDIEAPVIAGDSIVVEGSRIASVGTSGASSDCDVAIDAGGMMA
jgi:enamidase